MTEYRRSHRMCGWSGCDQSKSLHVHHILPLNKYPEYMDEKWNFICYCPFHHFAYHYTFSVSRNDNSHRNALHLLWANTEKWALKNKISTDDLEIEGGSGFTTLISAIGSGGATIRIDAAGIATNAGNHSTHTASTTQHGIPSGGNNGNVLSTNGSGTYSWIATSGTTDISAATSFPGQLTYYGGSGSGNEYDLDLDFRGTYRRHFYKEYYSFYRYYCHRL